MNHILAFTMTLSLLLTACGPKDSPDRGEIESQNQNVETTTDNDPLVGFVSSAYREKDQTRRNDITISTLLKTKSLGEVGYINLVKNKHHEGNSSCNVEDSSICEDEDYTSTCGSIAGSNFSEFVSGCANVNTGKQIWTGIEKGFAAETTWRLVSKVEDPDDDTILREVWQDTETGLVWSDVVASGKSWCETTGNDNDNGTNGNCSTNPSKGLNNICEAYHNADVALGKGNINGNAYTVVRWRAPTRNELLQADVNGIRFVHRAFRLANIANSNGTLNVWTSSTVSSSHKQAWRYNGVNGMLSKSNKETTTGMNTICVGWVTKDN